MINIREPIKLITELYPWQTKLMKKLMKKPDDRTIYWVWDNDGKFTEGDFVTYMMSKYDYVTCLNGRTKNLIKNACDYKIIIIYVDKYGRQNINYKDIKKLKNAHNHVVVLAFEKPLKSSRWKRVDLNDYE